MTCSSRRRQGGTGFSLVEVLVSALLLSVSIVGISVLTGVTRRYSEQSRGSGDYYAVARNEMERDKASGYRALFTNTGNRTGTTWRTDYGNVTPNNASGDADLPDRANYTQPLTTSNIAANAAPTTGCSTSSCNGRAAVTTYRAISTYALVTTGSETDNSKKLGVQTVKVCAPTGNSAQPFNESAPVYTTTAFYTDPTKW